MNKGLFFKYLNRIARSVRHRYYRLLNRVKFKCSFRTSSNLILTIYPWSKIAGLPGNPDYLPDGKHFFSSSEMRSLYIEIVCRNFRIFKDEPISISTRDSERKSAIRKYCQEIDQNILANYIPIEWHLDFYSGYCWPKDTFYQDIKVGPYYGVDIKIPRELSRFQHIGILASVSHENASTEFMLQVIDWIITNPYERGVNWECSMDVSLRAINWIWGLRFFEPELIKYVDFQNLVANSLRDHGRHIYENLDYYGQEIPTGNHYLADIAGLIYIGASFPQLPEANIWLAFGIQELISEMVREVLEDGMCHEASTSYHRLVTELFVSCAALVERLPIERKKQLNDLDFRLHKIQPPLRPLSESASNLLSNDQILPVWFYKKLELMVEFSLAIRKPNGKICQIGDNDSARVHKLYPRVTEETLDHNHLFSTVGELLGRQDFIEAGKSASLEAKLICGGLRVNAGPPENKSKPSFNIKLFPEAGIAVQSIGSAWLVVSCGTTGQGGRGGHGHNDKNSFEFSVGKFDFIVDGGCPFYTSASEERNRFRSTAMHSTISVVGVEQNSWLEGKRGLFSLQENASPKLELTNNGAIVGSHQGYGNLHSRKFQLSETNLVIEDVFNEKRDRHITFNLHPDISVMPIKSESKYLEFELQHKSKFVMQLRISGCKSFKVLPGAFSTGYMKPIYNHRLTLQISDDVIKSIFKWQAI